MTVGPGRTRCSTVAAMSSLHRAGWILFLVCAVLYAGSGIRAGDGLVVIGSIVFGLACILFLADRSSEP